MGRGKNPAARLPLGVTGVNSQLIVDVIMTDGDADAGVGRNCVSAGLEWEEVRLLLSQVMHLWRELANSREEATRRDATTKNSLTRLNGNMRRLAITLAGCSVDGGALKGNGSVAEAPCLVAELVLCPRTLHDL